MHNNHPPARRPNFLLLLFLLCLSSALYPLDLSISLDANASTETRVPVYGILDVRLYHEISGFSMLADISLTGEGTFGSLFEAGFDFAQISGLINEAGLAWHNDFLAFEVGKFVLQDEIQSPYSLALSSRGNSALTLSARYDHEYFYYSSRWFSLNFDSGETYTDKNDATFNWPDRSVVLKTYGVKLGDFRFGFQDIIIFTDANYGSQQRGPLFDIAYFAIPVPSFVMNVANSWVNSPFRLSQKLNENSINGLFLEWKHTDMTVQAQVFIDDFNLNRFLKPNDYQNPDKIAWSTGIDVPTNIGNFGFFHAGATKYTFASSGDGENDNLMYGYTYYPSIEYQRKSVLTTIDPELNYVGYLHGENNLAFMIRWNKIFYPFYISSNLELTITGQQSPANPWGAYTTFSQGGQGPKFLDDAVLEKKLLFRVKLEVPFDIFVFYFSASIGYVWNKLELTLVQDTVRGSRDNGIPYFYPSQNGSFIGAVKLGASIKLGGNDRLTKF